MIRVTLWPRSWNCYFSVECWGGATFDSCIRFLDEDPWERLRILRKELPHQKLQMLFRGQNMLGYRPYADDAVEYFVQKSVANGIDVIRIFDALNDPRNLQTAIKSANKEGAHVQGCISYTLSPVHNNEYFAAYAKTLEEMGANSICIKDMGCPAVLSLWMQRKAAAISPPTIPRTAIATDGVKAV